MTIGAHIAEFAGKPVVGYPDGPRPADAATVAWRIDDPDDEGIFGERLAALVAEPWAGQITALIVGSWGGPYDVGPPVEPLVEAAGRLPALRALFLGEMTYEECEISWIQQGDITPLLRAYPQLEQLTVRGATGLGLDPVRHTGLRRLVFESGGLPSEVVQSIGQSDLPNLEHLELWLGAREYGGDVTALDLSGILHGAGMPALRSLALRDAEIADQVAEAVAEAPVVARLSELDLSLGRFRDAGAKALLAGQPLTHLKRLDLHHHFFSPPVIARIEAELVAAGVQVDLSEGGDPDNTEEHYVAVSE